MADDPDILVPDVTTKHDDTDESDEPNVVPEGFNGDDANDIA